MSDQSSQQRFAIRVVGHLWRLRTRAGRPGGWMEHFGIVVDDLAAATECFVELGLELLGEGSVSGRRQMGWLLIDR